MPDRVGQQIGNYRLVSLLGRGGFADVYLGEHLHLNRRVAIKILHKHLSGSEQAGFKREAQIIEQLKHPNIIEILDFGIEQTNPYMVMEYLPEGNLRNKHPKGTIIPLPTAVDYVKQIAEALQLAHDQKIIHRDLKPENILVKGGKLLLSDFGIATESRVTAILLRQPSPYAGTLSYSAPEQLKGQERVASDQYALAIIVYEWLTGMRPFTGAVVQQHLHATPPPMKGVSSTVEAVVLKALAKDPHQRFANVQAFGEAFEQACQPVQPTVRVASPHGQSSVSALPPIKIASSPTPITTTLLIYEHLGGRSDNAAWSPDGTRVLSGGVDGTVHMWDSATGQTLLTFQDMLPPVVWSPDGRLFASASYDNKYGWSVGVWEAASGKLLHRHERHFSSSLKSMAWSPDGRLLVSNFSDSSEYSERNGVPVWEAVSGKLLHRYKGHTEHVNTVAWSPDGRLIASASYDKSVHVWEAVSGKLLQLYEGHSSRGGGHVDAVAWSPDGRLLASASYGSVQVWEAESGTLVQQYTATRGPISAVAWSLDGQLLAIDVYSDKSVHIWEPTSGKLLRRYKGNSLYRPIVAWSTDGRLLAALNGKVQVWDVGRDMLLCQYEGHKDEITAVAWSPDGRLLASASIQTGVQVWQAGSGKLLHRYEGHTEVILAIAWSPDGQRLASASDDKSVQVWEATSGKLLYRYQGHTDYVRSVTWSPDGRLLASASLDKSVQVWEPASGTLVHRYEGHSGWVGDVAWSPNGRYLASAGFNQDKSVQVWEAATGTLVHRYEVDDSSRAGVAWSPDGRYLASATSPQTPRVVQVWETATWNLLYQFENNRGFVHAIAWSPDGNCLASASFEEILVWAVHNKEVLLAYEHPGGVTDMAWSPGGKRIASAGIDVRIWVAPH